MRKMTPAQLRLLPLAALLGAVAACTPMRPQVEQEARDVLARSNDLNGQAMTGGTNSVPVVQRVSGAWLGGHAVPLQADATLPAVFDAPGFLFRFPGRANIMTIADKLTEVAHIPVHAEPDVLVPVSSLVSTQANLDKTLSADKPTQSGAAPATGVTTLPPLPSPQLGGSLAGGVSSTFMPSSNNEFEMNYQGTLRGYLELLSAQAGISWEYHGGIITLSRFVTRQFQVKAQPGANSFTAAVERQTMTQAGTSGNSTGTSSNQNSGGFNATSKGSKPETSMDIWAALHDQIETAKTPLGRFSISQATGTVTVTDTRSAVEQIQRIIDHENALITRQVTAKVEVLQVTLTDNQNYGVDWNAVFQKLSNKIPFAITYSSPASLLTSSAGSFGVTALTPTSPNQSATLAGSSAMIQALQQYGTVKVLTSADVTTMSRRAVPLAITKQTGYLASTTPATSTIGGTGGIVGLQPGTVTTGFMLNLLPTVLDSGNILLSFSLGISSLDNLATQSSGSGSSLQSIQTPTVSSTDVFQELPLKPGSTLVLSGYEQDSVNDTQNTLGNKLSVYLGGSETGTKTRTALVIMITPVLKETAI